MLMRWNPVEELTNLQREVDRLFDRYGNEAPAVPTGRAFVPATQVFADKNAWYVRMALPGVDPKGVEIEVTDNALSIRGERSDEQESREPHLSEISYGRFERTFTIPITVDANKVTASYKNGMLELTLPVQEAAKPRRIEIATADVKAVKAA